MNSLKITTFQAYLFWENIDKNLQNLGLRLSSIREKTDIIVLPEMFSTGFSMNAAALAEDMDGKAVKWMEAQAKHFECVVTGSLIIRENGKFYNRLIWMRPDGSYEYYDKRHLFGLGKEDDTYTAGDKKLIVELNGWKICTAICYDLRFPVWLRNTAGEYDMLLLVANWPERRSLHWRSLIPARAIENQCYVVGVNRIGTDAKGNSYTGDSSVFGPLGETLWQHSGTAVVHTVTLDKQALQKVRTSLPFLSDADKFILM